ncbi:unnamed protein product [Rhizoctonia solani]|uniref:Uncharacterized protein n=1 Tax=Rhizoctonia solani TaxID=456999 RepID=A0A8H3DP16_9AGAM|nr:unnamed protein product [Rhizoctonia solani]
MGELVAYLDVPPQKIVAIYERSRREPIHSYGYFINLMTAYNKDYPLDSLDRSIHRNGSSSKWMESLRDRLIAAGVHNSYVVDYPTLPQYRANKYCEAGWLVVLATGFNKKLIIPLAGSLVQRAQEIISTDKKPSWFTMNRFSYPNPKVLTNLMGELIAYPDVPPSKIVEIYKRSRRETINGYGFFIELMSAYDKVYPFNSPDRSIHGNKNSFKWMESLRNRLIDAGVHNSYVVDYPTPPKYRIGDYCDEGWLVILETGFNKTPHAPLEDGLVERVQEIIGTDKQPSWFTMKRFSYPDPKAWNACVVYKGPSDQRVDSSVSQQSTS